MEEFLTWVVVRFLPANRLVIVLSTVLWRYYVRVWVWISLEVNVLPGAPVTWVTANCYRTVLPLQAHFHSDMSSFSLLCLLGYKSCIFLVWGPSYCHWKVVDDQWIHCEICRRRTGSFPDRVPLWSQHVHFCFCSTRKQSSWAKSTPLLKVVGKGRSVAHRSIYWCWVQWAFELGISAAISHMWIFLIA